MLETNERDEMLTPNDIAMDNKVIINGKHEKLQDNGRKKSIRQNIKTKIENTE